VARIGEGFINVGADEVEKGFEESELEPFGALLLSFCVLDQEIENVIRADLIKLLFAELPFELIKEQPVILDGFFPQSSLSGTP
jgi:hypothetical protein